MSGVEVAGLVLGCLPLIIQGIEAYIEGLDPVKSFFRWEKQLPQFVRKLRDQHVHYAQTIRLLLGPITTEYELAEMLEDPGSARLWKNEEMSRKLEDRLQESFKSYQSTIVDIERITTEIAGKLNLDRAAETNRTDLEAIIIANTMGPREKFEFRKRVRFGIGKKRIEALLGELDICNKELERFTEKSGKIETFKKTVKPSFAGRLRSVQGYARNLHKSLMASWSCPCRSYHKTSLQLEQRSNLYASGLPKISDSKTCFTISFYSTSNDNNHPWDWQTAEIHVEEEEVEPSRPTRLVTKPKIVKSVSFGGTPPPVYTPHDPLSSRSPLPEINDICASIQKLHKHSTCIGFSLDSNCKLRGVYPVDSAEKRIMSCETVTLEELLSQPPTTKDKRSRLSKKERYSLALTLASSALQLSSTPWFPSLWSSKDIVFHQTSLLPRADVGHPYLTPQLVELPKTASNGQEPRGFCNKNTVLLALAVALLELYFGTSATQRQDDLLNENPWALCAMAYTWAQEEQENLSAAFSSAVTHCLKCFNDPSASLQDADFLQAAVESVVLPLQEELWQFLGKAA